jgi:hypothetical protein
MPIAVMLDSLLSGIGIPRTYAHTHEHKIAGWIYESGVFIVLRVDS